MAETTYCSSKILIELQANLKTLSEKLNETYDFLRGNESQLGETWMDDKFSEFDEEFKDSREVIFELSERYKEWADKALPPYIEIMKKWEKMQATLGK